MEKNIPSVQGLRKFISDFGIMDHLVCGGYKEQTSKGTDFIKEFRKYGIYLNVTNTDCHNQSKVEGLIRKMSKKWFIFILRKKVPHILLGYVLRRVTKIVQRNYGSAGSLHYRKSIEEVTGETSDISDYLDIHFITRVGTMITPAK